MTFKICKNCKEKNNPSFKICWKCKYSFDTNEFVKPQASQSPETIRINGAGGGFVFVGSAILIFGVQCFYWLKEGRWFQCSILDAMIFLTARSEAGTPMWLVLPNAWIGLHKLLSAIPVSLFFFGMGWLFFTIDFEINSNRTE